MRTIAVSALVLLALASAARAETATAHASVTVVAPAAQVEVSTPTLLAAAAVRRLTAATAVEALVMTNHGRQRFTIDVATGEKGRRAAAIAGVVEAAASETEAVAFTLHMN